MADSAAPVSTAASTSSATHPQFDTALRGYERRQVDALVADRDATIARLEAEVSDTRRRLAATAEHVEYLENELRQRPVAGSGPSGDEGFGMRAEKLLRLAEQEAAELRNQASADSTSIIEQARTDAEKHRHEIEQDLISRGSALEQQATRRAAELQEREQQISDQLSSARDQAEQLHATAVRAADRLRDEAAAVAEETKLRAENTAKRLVDQANQEVGRLSALQAGVRSELARLAEVLSKEVG